MIALINVKSWITSGPFIYFVVIIMKCQVDGTVANIGPSQSWYIQVTESNPIVHSVIQTWTESTPVQCARHCASFLDCDFFLWNSSNGNCLAFDSRSVTNKWIPVTDSTNLYLKTLTWCPLDKGYHIRSSGVLARCLFLSSQPMTFEKSKNECARHGARLFKSNTLELISLVVEMALERGLNSYRVRIGLDDTVSENTFVWSDGSVMTSEERGNLFLSPQPDDSGNEDCGEIMLMTGTLNDNQCYEKHMFACEMERF